MELPVQTRNFEGRERRVGVEIEFAGLEAEQAAAAVMKIYGGEAVYENRFLAHVRNTSAGDFKIELDAEFLQSERYRHVLASVGIEIPDDGIADRLEEVLARVAATFVPLEICSPPLAMSRLDAAEDLVRELRAAGALGTARSPLYAFGLQFNPEVVSLESGYILAVMQSFLLQFDAICRSAGIDLTRRLLPFVRPFSDEFRAHVCRVAYEPSLDQLIDDYLRFTPTRNRPLDMLPLFAFVDSDTVLARAEEPDLIKPRPTFHYRLPDCHIDQSDWKLADAWSWWLRIEELAGNAGELRDRLQQFEDR